MASPLKKASINPNGFNAAVNLPFNLRKSDFEAAMQDIYDFLSDTNQFLVDKGLPRLDDTVRAANMSGLLSDMLTDSMAKHARNMARNKYHNGHPDLLVGGVYPDNSVQSGTEGVEIKATNKKGGGWTHMVHATSTCACSCTGQTATKKNRSTTCRLLLQEAGVAALTRQVHLALFMDGKLMLVRSST